MEKALQSRSETTSPGVAGPWLHGDAVVAASNGAHDPVTPSPRPALFPGEGRFLAIAVLGAAATAAGMATAMEVDARGQLLACYFSGLALLCYGLALLRRTAAARRWPTRPGRVLSSSVATLFATKEKGGGSDVQFAPDVLYEYSDASGIRESRTFAVFGPAFRSQKRQYVDNLLLAYQPGALLEVHVCPTEPRWSVLRADVPPDMRYLAIAALIAGGLAMFFSVFNVASYWP